MPASPDDEIAAAAQARVGRTLRQKWRLDRLIGVGGMAAVYAATHRNENRAAVKVLHDELCAVDEIKRRFLREAYVANKVTHPGSVRVLDDDTDTDGTTFLVMDLLEGETLAQRLERGPKRMFAAEVLKISDQLLDVLAAAHDQSIVHRDVKPENVFLTTAGQTKLLDFGFARVLDAAQLASSMTGVRTTLGTPAFMPPEQAAGRWNEVDRRSDLWALGATMFFALSGEHVHEGKSLADVLVAAATQPARSLQSVASHLSPAVVAVVQRALAFEMPMRWPDARTMQKAVRDAMKSAPSVPPVHDSDEKTIVVRDEPTLKRPPGPAASRPAAPRPAAPRPAVSASRPPPPRPAAGAPPSARAPNAAPPDAPPPDAPAPPPVPMPARTEPMIEDNSVSETMLAVRFDESGAPLPGVSRLSDPGGPSSVPRPPDSVPSAGRVVVETTPYVAEVVAEVVPREEDSPEAPPVSSFRDPPLPRGFRQPAPSSPFWEQSSSGVQPPPDIRDLPPMRPQQATAPAIGGRAQIEKASNKSMLVIAAAAGFLFVVFAGLILILFLR